MSDRQAPQDPGYATRIGDSSDPQVDELLNRARKAAIPAAVIALAVIAVAFVATAKKEGVRKANAAAYELLQTADEFEGGTPDEKAENVGKMRAVFEKVIADHPESVAADEAAMRMAALELGAGNFDKALTGFGAVSDAATDVSRADTAKVGKANALIGLEKYDEALKVLADLAGRPDSIYAVEASYRSAVVCYRKGDLDGARKHLDVVLAADEHPDLKQLATTFQERLDLFDPEAVKASFVAPEPKADEDADAEKPDGNTEE